MPIVTRFTDRVRGSLRMELLDAATDLLVTGGYRGLRMADVAAAVGVSRQTVYNEFGDKEGLAAAVLMRRTEEFLVAIDDAMRRAADPATAIHDAALVALRRAAADPLIAAVVTGGASGAAADVLPFVATPNAEPVLRAATEHVARHLARLRPDAEHGLLAESVVRLAISHMLLPIGPAEQAAEHIAEIAVAALGARRRHERNEES